jgi:hypothetical protein
LSGNLCSLFIVVGRQELCFELRLRRSLVRAVDGTNQATCQMDSRCVEGELHAAPEGPSSYQVHGFQGESEEEAHGAHRAPLQKALPYTFRWASVKPTSWLVQATHPNLPLGNHPTPLGPRHSPPTHREQRANKPPLAAGTSRPPRAG